VIYCNSGLPRRVKKEVAPLTGSLDRLMLMKPVNFRWKDPARGTGPQIGLIAQDVAKVYPQLAFTGSDGLMGVDYAKPVPPLIDAVLELKVNNDNLRAEFEAYKRVHP
jgi:Chaperone of endosialidase